MSGRDYRPIPSSPGALAWIASAMSHSMDALRGRLRWLFLFVGSLGLIQFAKLIILLPAGFTAGALTTDVNPQHLLGRRSSRWSRSRWR